MWKSRLERKPDAGNLHVRFDEGEGGGINAAPSLLYSPSAVLLRLISELGSLVNAIHFASAAIASSVRARR